MANAKKKSKKAKKAANDVLHWKMLEEKWSHDALPDGFTYRAEVPGGWLVAVWAGPSIKKHGLGGGLTFVPDPDRKWRAKLRP